MEGRDLLLGTVCLLGTESGGCVAVNSQGKMTLTGAPEVSGQLSRSDWENERVLEV